MGLIEATSKSTNHTTHTSGVVLVASILDGLMRLNWNNSNGDTATDVIVGSFLKDVINNFVQKSQVTINAPSGQTEIVKMTDTYVTSFGTIRVRQHRVIQVSTDATGRIMAYNPSKLRKAWLQMPFIDQELTRAGDYEPRAVVGQFTLEVRNQDSAWFADGLNIG